MSVELVSIVLPVHNQADHLEQITKEYLNELAGLRLPFELLLVENGSRDETLSTCRRLAAEHPEVRPLHSDPGGWGRAVRLGLSEAMGDILCFTNSARTSPRDLLLSLLYAVAYPTVVVKANRKIRDSALRRLGSLLYNIEVRTLFDLNNWDVNGTPKVFPREFGDLLDLTRDDDLIDLEFCVRCRRSEHPMIEVPTFSARRHGGRSTTGYESALKMYAGALQLWRSGQ